MGIYIIEFFQTLLLYYKRKKKKEQNSIQYVPEKTTQKTIQENTIAKAFDFTILIVKSMA